MKPTKTTLLWMAVALGVALCFLVGVAVTSSSFLGRACPTAGAIILAATFGLTVSELLWG